MKCIILEPQKLERLDSDIIRRCTIKRMDDDLQVDLQELWFQFSNKITPPEDNDCDSYLLALLMDAMNEGRKIIVKGNVSLSLLSNLVEYQAAWNKWLPDMFTIIDIDVESIRDNEKSVSGAICAFSGGVDATFSVWRHTQKKNSYRSQTINLCTFVHGFDIPLSDNNAFENARKKATETLNDVSIDLVPIKTNYREISTAKWDHTHGCALVATLSNFKNVAGTCLLGSSDPYDNAAQAIPWGSHPIIDYLLSSDGFKVMHDGSSHSRTEKVSEINDWKVGISNLRVCWQGDLKDRNCGKCEKCLRTQCNFLANGYVIPDCFPETSGEEINIENISFHRPSSRIDWEDILKCATMNQVQQPWVSQLTKFFNESTLVDIIFPKKSFQWKIAGKLKYLFKL
jgi:hypothetical protein